MSYYDEYYNDWYEQSEFSEKIEELKNELRKSVKQEIINEINRLRAENEELKSFKDNWAIKMQEVESAKAEAEQAMKQAEKEAKKARLHELLEPCTHTMYGIGTKWGFIREKCDKCDDKRKIRYKTPLGRDATEDCECSEKRLIYYPAEAEIFKFQQKLFSGKPSGEVCIYFRYSRSDELYGEDVYEKTLNVYNGEPFEDISHRTVFPTKEKAQEFCDWKNLVRKESEQE